MIKKTLTASRAVPKGDSHRDVILHHVESGGNTPLTDFQKELLERWTFTDELLRRNQGFKRREAIAGMIMHRFEVSRATAFNYIVNAEFVWSSSAPRNKRYLIGNRIDAMEQNIMLATIEATKDPSLWGFVAQLEKVLLGYIKEYPDYTPARSPKTIVFNITQNNLVVGSENITVDEAVQEAEQVLKELQDGTNF